MDIMETMPGGSGSSNEIANSAALAFAVFAPSPEHEGIVAMFDRLLQVAREAFADGLGTDGVIGLQVRKQELTQCFAALTFIVGRELLRSLTMRSVGGEELAVAVPFFC